MSSRPEATSLPMHTQGPPGSTSSRRGRPPEAVTPCRGPAGTHDELARQDFRPARSSSRHRSPQATAAHSHPAISVGSYRDAMTVMRAPARTIARAATPAARSTGHRLDSGRARRAGSESPVGGLVTAGGSGRSKDAWGVLAPVGADALAGASSGRCACGNSRVLARLNSMPAFSPRWVVRRR
jgi:hypothetical protein